MIVQRNKNRLLIISNILCWVLLLYILFVNMTNTKNKQFEEITTERINIVNEDGKRVIAISNKERIAPPVVNGKEYPVEFSEGREYMAGMIFFNEEGDEMGGLTFNSFKMPNGKVAGVGHLSFDRFKDNQVVALQYIENRDGVKSGLAMYNRPGDGTFPKYFELLEEINSKNTSAERLKQIKDSIKLISEKKMLGGETIFLGNKNKIPQLVMKDETGHIRVRLYVDKKNVARLQFFDDKGELVEEYPDSKQE